MSILLADIDATCWALGHYDGQDYQAEPDTIKGLKHLIWILRRDVDNHKYRRYLGHTNILQTDLVFMLSTYVKEEEYADVLIRLLVILTNPTLLLYRDGPPKDSHGRKVFMELIDILQGYKKAFTNETIWKSLFTKLKQALKIDWATRSEEQSLLIERILVLIRNVLQVPANTETECKADNDASVHDKVIWGLHQSGILDLVLFIISSPDEHQFHLHGLEILCLLYREQTAEFLVEAAVQRSVGEKQRDEENLMAARRREKARLQARPPLSRHSRFGGTYVLRNLKSVSDRDIICHQPLQRATAMDFDREKERQKPSHRHIKEEAQVTRRSALSVRLCLREYCIEVLRSAYNGLVRQVRRVLERNVGSSNHDDSYLLWAIRFFMQFNRLSGLQLELVSESLSIQCFHWVLTRIQHDMDMIVSDKKQARLWAKRLHVALQTFHELLESLLALQKLNNDDNAAALFDMLLNNVCYVLEYRETILYLLMNYNEAHSTKAYLRVVMETAKVFINIMEKFCNGSVVVQDKKGKKRGGGKKKNHKQSTKRIQETEEELSNKWSEMESELNNFLVNELKMDEEDQPIPFDATLEKSIDEQREDCIKRLNKLLRTGQLEQTVALLRAAREVWPENDIFGAISSAPEDEMLLLREIYMHNIITVEPEEDDNGSNDDEADDIENEELEDNGLTEKTFKFDDFGRRLLHPKIVRACTLVLEDWQLIPTKSVKAAVTILHRIAYHYSCPGMLYQAKLFRIFQQVFHAPRDAHQEELRRLGIFVIRKFVNVAPSNPKIYAELLFYKTIREANELETGYCNDYDAGAKGTWTEEQESELRFLFEENQRNPETDKDVIDWILDNLNDKTRTRRGILKKLKDLGLMFKAPTKKSNANAANKNQWRVEEDELLSSLYDQHRTEEDCLARILHEFEERRNKQQIIKRMLQLRLIADKSEILPPKQHKRKSKQRKDSDDNESGVEEIMEEPMFGEDGNENSDVGNSNRQSKKQKKKQRKSVNPKLKQRKVVRTPLDVGTVRALLSKVDNDKYKEAIEWLQECLDDAGDDTEEPAEEDDGVPLLPLLDVQKEAMEDGEFKKVLVSLGIQPPIEGMENYWRIPTYLNSADLKMRAKIVGGEELDFEVNKEGDSDDGDDDDDDADDNGHEDDSDNDDDDEDNESEEDYLETRIKQRESTYAEEQQTKLNSLMYSKSDEESESREPLKQHQSRKEKRKQTNKQRRHLQFDDESDDDDANDLVNEIKRKLDRKKQKPDVTSDDEEMSMDDVEQLIGNDNRKLKDTSKSKQSSSASKPSRDGLFDQLKAKRAEITELKDTFAGNEANNSDADDQQQNDYELNFNSEDYRKRLLELDDSDNENSDNNDKEAGAENEESKHITVSGKNRTRRVNVIESDSDEHVDDVDVERRMSRVGSNGSDDGDITSNQVSSHRHQLHHLNHDVKQKRPRSIDSDNDSNDDDIEDNDTNFIKRKKHTKTAKDENKPTKRRRIAIIDDDDDDDF